MMDAFQLPSSVSATQAASHYGEFHMKQSFNFLDSLKVLYIDGVVNTLKDYATKAFINTVDHLGTMTYKVNYLLDDKIEEAFAIELRLSCSTGRLRMCEMFIDHGGLSQQSLAIRIPKHHMRYILPVWSWLMLKNFLSVSKAKDGGDSKGVLYCMTNAVYGEMSSGIYPRNIETPVSFARRPRSATQFPQSSLAGTLVLHPTKKQVKKRASPFQFQLTRLGSLVDRSTSPNPSNAKRQFPLELRRSTSMPTHVERNRRTDIELFSSKNKHLFKALLSMLKSRKDSKLYKFLDKN
ncbi:hypothetical protein ACJRO7_019823 [Eucalyptus globulus]|uniref:Uncharacterized protein n=1 Tax=Eucalyptus globulus TaxID=34317 RepID=A0ABD3KEN7_EUCGL